MIKILVEKETIEKNTPNKKHFFKIIIFENIKQLINVKQIIKFKKP